MTWFVELLHRDGSVLSRSLVRDNQFTMGRALDNDLVLDDAHCAAHHARLQIGPDGQAALHDLGSINGIAPQRGKRTKLMAIIDDQPVRIGQSLIRIRSSAWALPPEQPIIRRIVWPFTLLALAVVLGHSAWEIWLTDVQEKSPAYLYALTSAAAGIAIWSGLYALLGRLISGNERFFSHVLIVCCGLLAGVVAGEVLELISFATGWLWPERIAQYVFIAIVALTVRAHLRLADPRHWPTLRWGVAVATAAAMIVPVAQLWISSRQLTTIQTLHNLEHPALRLAPPSTVAGFNQNTAALQARVDALRKEDQHDEEFVSEEQ
jgi:TRAP-type C4-dicarboxylate transport system permease small subunit